MRLPSATVVVGVRVSDSMIRTTDPAQPGSQRISVLHVPDLDLVVAGDVIHKRDAARRVTPGSRALKPYVQLFLLVSGGGGQVVYGEQGVQGGAEAVDRPVAALGIGDDG
ncbi:hypothetical protein M2271_008370 [Streptomyces sp. LBL]|nr:hypothetical protein [Streptomyces sp. LBL]